MLWYPFQYLTHAAADMITGTSSQLRQLFRLCEKLRSSIVRRGLSGRELLSCQCSFSPPHVDTDRP